MISPRQSFHSARNPLHRRKARRGPTSRKTRVGFCRSFRTRCRGLPLCLLCCVCSRRIGAGPSWAWVQSPPRASNQFERALALIPVACVCGRSSPPLLATTVTAASSTMLVWHGPGGGGKARRWARRGWLVARRGGASARQARGEAAGREWGLERRLGGDMLRPRALRTAAHARAPLARFTSSPTPHDPARQVHERRTSAAPPPRRRCASARSAALPRRSLGARRLPVARVAAGRGGGAAPALRDRVARGRGGGGLV